MPKRIAIIGGGISGLSAAFTLEEKRRTEVPVEYVVYEANPRLGGVLVTECVEDCLVEAGPDSFLTEKPWAADLCRQIGLGDQLIGSNDRQRKTYILSKGRLVAMPDGLMFMVPTKILPTVFSSLFSLRTKIRMAREWFHPLQQSKADETVADLIERHYGAAMVDILADPLLSGVYGGEASQLSVRAVLPRFADMEAKHGSHGRALLSTRKTMAAATKGSALPLFTSLKKGMQQMVEALVTHLNPDSLRPSAPVWSVVAQDHGWAVSAGYQSDHFDGLIIATPAPAASSLLQMADENLSRELGEIRYSSSVTITLGYDETVRRSLPRGFGFLVPRTEGRRMLAATFVHNKFPHRAPPNRAIIRCFLGGTRDERILHSSDNDILQLVRDELKQILGLAAEPLFARIFKWKGAMAQYGVGHLERVQRIESLRQKLPALALAGNAFAGIGVPDCVRSGKEAAIKVLTAIGLEDGAA
jgi:oxygen-dependent protoporphyrinogen oxidase